MYAPTETGIFFDSLRTEKVNVKTYPNKNSIENMTSTSSKNGAPYLQWDSILN